MLPVFRPGLAAREADQALKAAAAAETSARQCAVLWFGEILARGLYRDLGHASMLQYARVELGWSETRIGDFMRLSRRLDTLPAVKAALPEIGYTKAREIVAVASPRTEDRWVEAARTSSRTQLVAQVKRAKAQAAARRRPAAAPLFAPAPAEAALAAEVPVRITLEFTPEQHARWEVLLESVRKAGASGGTVEVLLAALQSAAGSDCRTTASDEATPRGRFAPPVQVHVHECPRCGSVEAGGRAFGSADAARVRCDAAVSEPGKRNTTTIPPRTRRAVLARDRHRCQAPGCGRTQFLEVHHVKPRARGGANDATNLVTLCASCHRLWHERR
ncbi:MAG TPA: HNH endonuclease signature motif containing protein [Candidatus Krumholzibacteria bacterium]|nr:HNH endonuclease signature motif containing protein [Candidatus Krumholzibacteria bacterium]